MTGILAREFGQPHPTLQHRVTELRTQDFDREPLPPAATRPRTATTYLPCRDPTKQTEKGVCAGRTVSPPLKGLLWPAPLARTQPSLLRSSSLTQSPDDPLRSPVCGNGRTGPRLDERTRPPQVQDMHPKNVNLLFKSTRGLATKQVLAYASREWMVANVLHVCCMHDDVEILIIPSPSPCPCFWQLYAHNQLPQFFHDTRPAPTTISTPAIRGPGLSSPCPTPNPPANVLSGAEGRSSGAEGRGRTGGASRAKITSPHGISGGGCDNRSRGCRAAFVLGAVIGPWGKELLQRLLQFVKQEGPEGLGYGGKGVSHVKSHAIEQGCIQNLC